MLNRFTIKAERIQQNSKMIAKSSFLDYLLDDFNIMSHVK
ncbi:hypothetical protein VR7878_00452 [Vibrio ruber DSM 16370]|uniref:Uncharacterized protein n=1 Tax=Vibrio ruber (strain DSM 16370 / JCM 11486 / BCRC 17186 / CECT 7878 / LMG 23124 / VR1) TaxID=1123498 RepID=A0A1R4LAV5_VIBR1|nr:hypothetical protein VR7878_00452 [Vibrio ruber DSM 16370]